MVNRVSDVLAERISQDSLKLNFASNILQELENINYPSMTLAMPTLFKYSSQWQQVM